MRKALYIIPFILGLILLLPVGFGANITYEISTCTSNITLSEQTIIEVDMITNITTQFENVNCIHGCNNVTNTCNDPSSDFSFLGLVIFGMISGGFVIFLIMSRIAKDGLNNKILIMNSLTRTIFTLLSLILVYSTVMIIALYALDLEGILLQYGNIYLAYFQGLQAVFLFLIAYVFLVLLVQSINGLRGKKKPFDEDDEDDDD